jgi:hypothetical protein
MRCVHGIWLSKTCEACMEDERVRDTAKPLFPSKAEVRLDTYGLVQRAVEEGIAKGYRRAFTHTDAPGEEALRESIDRAVMDALCEVLRFD